ncbi:MAG: hypothetical protein WCV88_02860 [Patescibacteria group bacterium]
MGQALEKPGHQLEKGRSEPKIDPVKDTQEFLVKVWNASGAAIKQEIDEPAKPLLDAIGRSDQTGEVTKAAQAVHTNIEQQAELDQQGLLKELHKQQEYLKDPALVTPKPPEPKPTVSVDGIKPAPARQ